MSGEEINFLALPAVFMLALVGAPIAFRRAAYPAGKAVFGTLAIAVAALGIAGMVTAIQRKAGIEALPLAWLVAVALGGFLHRLR